MVGRVDLVVDARVGFIHKDDIFLDIAGADVTLPVCLGGAEPHSTAPLVST